MGSSAPEELLVALVNNKLVGYACPDPEHPFFEIEFSDRNS